MIPTFTSGTNGPSARHCANHTILAQGSRLDPAEVALGVEEDVELQMPNTTLNRRAEALWPHHASANLFNVDW